MDVNDNTVDEELAPPVVRSIYPPLVWIAMCAGFILWSQDLDETSKAAPMLVGYAGLVLGAIDLAARFHGSVPDMLKTAFGAGFERPEITHNPKVSVELGQMAWMAAFVFMLLFIGVLPAVPLYVLGSMRLNGRRSWKESLIAAAATLFFVVMVFEVFLAFELYRGVLFDERGFDKW